MVQWVLRRFKLTPDLVLSTEVIQTQRYVGRDGEIGILSHLRYHVLHSQCLSLTYPLIFMPKNTKASFRDNRRCPLIRGKLLVENRKITWNHL